MTGSWNLSGCIRVHHGGLYLICMHAFAFIHFKIDTRCGRSNVRREDKTRLHTVMHAHRYVIHERVPPGFLVGECLPLSTSLLKGEAQYGSYDWIFVHVHGFPRGPSMTLSRTAIVGRTTWFLSRKTQAGTLRVSIAPRPRTSPAFWLLVISPPRAIE